METIASLAKKPAKKINRRKLVENIRGWGIIGPIILYYAIFGLIPLGIVLYKSMFAKDGLFAPEEFVGFGNYVKFFTDPEYYMLLIYTCLIAVFTIGLSLVLGMIIALLATGPIKGKGFYRTVYYIPVVVSMAVVAQIVRVWLAYDGSINNLLVSLKLDKVIWKDSTFWMYFWIIVICVWKGLGATVILFIAGLNAIPAEIYEAADVDGATPVVKFFKITLPQLRHMLVFVMITSIIGAFNVFEPVQLISGGGPEGTTKVVLFQIYNESFQNGNWGMGSAISVVILIILMILTVLNMKFGEEKD